MPEIAAAAPPVLEVRNLTKVYPMGEVRRAGPRPGVQAAKVRRDRRTATADHATRQRFRSRAKEIAVSHLEAKGSDAFGCILVYS